MTPAMVERAEAEAVAGGQAGLVFSRGDATALEEADASYDGAITRFSLHHIPAPSRVIEEMARVVRPGGWVVVGDHLTDADSDAAAWHQEIERLRDPTHWASQTPSACGRWGRAPASSSTSSASSRSSSTTRNGSAAAREAPTRRR